MRVVVKNDQFGGDTTTLRELGEEVTVEELMHMVRDEPVCKDKAAGWCFARYDGTRLSPVFPTATPMIVTDSQAKECYDLDAGLAIYYETPFVTFYNKVLQHNQDEEKAVDFECKDNVLRIDNMMISLYSNLDDHEIKKVSEYGLTDSDSNEFFMACDGLEDLNIDLQISKTESSAPLLYGVQLSAGESSRVSAVPFSKSIDVKDAAVSDLHFDILAPMEVDFIVMSVFGESVAVSSVDESPQSVQSHPNNRHSLRPGSRLTLRSWKLQGKKPTLADYGVRGEEEVLTIVDPRKLHIEVGNNPMAIRFELETNSSTVDDLKCEIAKCLAVLPEHMDLELKQAMGKIILKSGNSLASYPKLKNDSTLVLNVKSKNFSWRQRPLSEILIHLVPSDTYKQILDREIEIGGVAPTSSQKAKRKNINGTPPPATQSATQPRLDESDTFDISIFDDLIADNEKSDSNIGDSQDSKKGNSTPVTNQTSHVDKTPKSGSQTKTSSQTPKQSSQNSQPTTSSKTPKPAKTPKDLKTSITPITSMTSKTPKTSKTPGTTKTPMTNNDKSDRIPPKSSQSTKSSNKTRLDEDATQDDEAPEPPATTKTPKTASKTAQSVENLEIPQNSGDESETFDNEAAVAAAELETDDMEDVPCAQPVRLEKIFNDIAEEEKTEETPQKKMSTPKESTKKKKKKREEEEEEKEEEESNEKEKGERRKRMRKSEGSEGEDSEEVAKKTKRRKKDLEGEVEEQAAEPKKKARKAADEEPNTKTKGKKSQQEEKEKKEKEKAAKEKSTNKKATKEVEEPKKSTKRNTKATSEQQTEENEKNKSKEKEKAKDKKGNEKQKEKEKQEEKEEVAQADQAEEEQSEFKVEKLLTTKITKKDGKQVRHFKVHWLGFADNDDTWEREEDLMESGYQELIDDYKKSHKLKDITAGEEKQTKKVDEKPKKAKKKTSDEDGGDDQAPVKTVKTTETTDSIRNRKANAQEKEAKAKKQKQEEEKGKTKTKQQKQKYEEPQPEKKTKAKKVIHKQPEPEEEETKVEESKKKAKRTGKPTNGKSDQTRVEEDAEMDAEVDGTPRETTKRAGEGDEEEMDNTNDHDDDILPDSASAYETITGIWGARMSPQDSSIEIAVEWENGTKSYLPSPALRKYRPQLLLDFYETRLKFVSQSNSQPKSN